MDEQSHAEVRLQRENFLPWQIFIKTNVESRLSLSSKEDRNKLILSTFIFLESAGCKVPTWYTTKKRDAFGAAAKSHVETAEESFERHWDRNEASIL
jgi:hypothetical protein